MKNQNIPTLVIIAFVSLGIGFFAGTKYQPSPKTDFVNQFNNRNNRTQGAMGGQRQTGSQPGIQAGTARGAMGIRPVAGEITSSDEKSLTVKMMDGSSKIILLSVDTQINKAQTATVTELKVGEKVSIFGQQNPDGSVTAQSVQLNPAMPNAPITPTATPKK